VRAAVVAPVAGTAARPIAAGAGHRCVRGSERASERGSERALRADLHAMDACVHGHSRVEASVVDIATART